MVALARPVVTESSVVDFGADVHVRLTVTQPVLWRLFTLNDPMRLVLEFGEVDWSGVDVSAMLDSDAVLAISAGPGEPGWSRLVLDLAQPLKVETAGMSTAAQDGSAVLKLQLTPTTDKSFREQVDKLKPEALAGAPLHRPFPARPPPTRCWWCWTRAMGASIPGRRRARCRNRR